MIVLVHFCLYFDLIYSNTFNEGNQFKELSSKEISLKNSQAIISRRQSKEELEDKLSSSII
jgi:hypothetical protein